MDREPGVSGQSGLVEQQENIIESPNDDSGQGVASLSDQTEDQTPCPSDEAQHTDRHHYPQVIGHTEQMNGRLGPQDAQTSVPRVDLDACGSDDSSPLSEQDIPPSARRQHSSTGNVHSRQPPVPPAIQYATLCDMEALKTRLMDLERICSDLYIQHQTLSAQVKDLQRDQLPSLVRGLDEARGFRNMAGRNCGITELVSFAHERLDHVPEDMWDSAQLEFELTPQPRATFSDCSKLRQWASDMTELDKIDEFLSQTSALDSYRQLLGNIFILLESVKAEDVACTEGDPVTLVPSRVISILDNILRDHKTKLEEPEMTRAAAATDKAASSFADYLSNASEFLRSARSIGEIDAGDSLSEALLRETELQQSVFLYSCRCLAVLAGNMQSTLRIVDEKREQLRRDARAGRELRTHIMGLFRRLDQEATYNYEEEDDCRLTIRYLQSRMRQDESVATQLEEAQEKLAHLLQQSPGLLNDYLFELDELGVDGVFELPYRNVRLSYSRLEHPRYMFPYIISAKIEGRDVIVHQLSKLSFSSTQLDALIGSHLFRHVCKPLDVFEDANFTYIVFPHYQRGSLLQYLAENPDPESLRVIMKCLVNDLLAPMHAAGVEHGALRGDCIIVTDNGQCVFSTFSYSSGHQFISLLKRFAEPAGSITPRFHAYLMGDSVYCINQEMPADMEALQVLLSATNTRDLLRVRTPQQSFMDQPNNPVFAPHPASQPTLQ